MTAWRAATRPFFTVVGEPASDTALASKIEAHNGYIRFSWAAGGTEQAPLYPGGTDVAMSVRDGRPQSVTGFVDAAPAPVAWTLVEAHWRVPRRRVGTGPPVWAHHGRDADRTRHVPRCRRPEADGTS